MSNTATMEVTRPTAAKQGFKQIIDSSLSAMFVLEKQANHAKSMEILAKANLVPYERQEILLLLTKDFVLKGALKGKWFYIAGKGIDNDGLFTIDEKGELVERKGNVSVEDTVRVWKGNNPLSLGVYSGVGVALCGGRFGLYAYDGPADVAPVVVGKAKAEPKLEQLAELLAKQAKEQLESLLRQTKLAEWSTVQLKGTTKPEVLEPIEEMIRIVKELEIKS